jgi:hypothetical protein
MLHATSRAQREERWRLRQLASAAATERQPNEPLNLIAMPSQHGNLTGVKCLS